MYSICVIYLVSVLLARALAKLLHLYRTGGVSLLVVPPVRDIDDPGRGAEEVEGRELDMQRCYLPCGRSGRCAGEARNICASPRCGRYGSRTV